MVCQADADGDGFFERHATVTRGATIDEDRTVGTEYSSRTRMPVRRQTVTQTGASVRLVREEADPTGTLRLVADVALDSPLPEARRPEFRAKEGATDAGNTGSSGCTPEHESLRAGSSGLFSSAA